MHLEIPGLEQPIRRLEAAAETGDEAALEAAQSLAPMQVMGARNGGAGGTRRLYDLALADDGRILLNGNDAGVLMRTPAEPRYRPQAMVPLPFLVPCAWAKLDSPTKLH